jgi:hypothetical protein
MYHLDTQAAQLNIKCSKKDTDSVEIALLLVAWKLVL